MGTLSPAPGPHPRVARSRRKIALSSGFWISVGSCVALGVVLAMFLPSRIQKTRRLRAKQTMSDLRAIATVVEAYAVDNGRYPSLPHLVSAGGRRFDPRDSNDWKPPAAWPVRMEQRVEALEGVLSPLYIKNLPARDRWGHPYLYVTTSDRQHYSIVSTGPDGKQASVHKRTWYSESDRDLVYSDGTFFEWLEGT